MAAMLCGVIISVEQVFTKLSKYSTLSSNDFYFASLQFLNSSNFALKPSIVEMTPGTLFD